MDLTFTDISYKAPSRFPSLPFPCRKGAKQLLDNVSGQFRCRELSCIMGPSGAGKSTLLNILAGYTKSGYEGRIAVDGMERCLDDFYNVSCYIMQDDQLHDLLTVREIMFTAASLKLGPKIDKKFKQTKISNILKGLGLIDSLDTRTGQLSGGQRKRLSIALELINNPPIMFFDEPTSGLDSSHSKQCIDLLKKLAADGRTVIMTVHQPSASMLFEADLVYCLSPGGRCSYAGSPHNIIHYMDRLHGLQCPSSHNPADFLIEVCSGEYGERTDDLVKTSKNGKNLDWRKKTPGWDNPIINSNFNTETDVPLLPQEQEIEIDGKLTKIQQIVNDKKCLTSFLSQLWILMGRAFRILLRDHFLTWSLLLVHAGIAFLVGFFFSGIGNDAAFVFDNFSLLFFTVMFLAFAACSSVIISFPMEMPIIRRETFNRWYTVKSYYFSKMLAEAPVQLMCTTLFCGIIYWISDQPRDWTRFFLFLNVCLVTSLLAQSLGYFIGATMKVQNGVIFGPLLLLSWLIVSGFFLHMNDVEIDCLRWLFMASYIRYALEGLMLAIYGYSRPPMDCSIDYCHFIVPSKFLKELDMQHFDYWTDIGVLVGMLAGTRILTYFVLLYQLRHAKRT